MEKIRLSSSLEVSRITLGFWRLIDWKITLQKLQEFVESAVEMGVTTTDHADIYGDYQCEAEFGRLLNIAPSIRDQIQLVSKCGIKIKSAKHPSRNIGYYDTSADHIIRSAEQSLKNFNTDYLDLLLIHRPDPLLNPEEVASAFEKLKKAGKVLNFGVSNFNPLQFETLDHYCTDKLVTNQVEISPYCLEHFHNGNMDFFLKEKICPMAWSPLAGGRLVAPDDEKGKRIHHKLEEIADKQGEKDIVKIIYAWILKHPARAIPVVGTGKTERLRTAFESLKVDLTREEWFEILIASQGHPVP
jgi:predicted oxidoreductase